MTIAADKLKKAKEDYDKGLKYLDKNVQKAIMQIKVSDAKTAYDMAVTRLNNLLGHANQIEVTLDNLQRQACRSRYGRRTTGA